MQQAALEECGDNFDTWHSEFTSKKSNAGGMTRHQVLMTTALTIAETITASKRHLEGQGSCLMRAAFLRSGFVRGTHV